MPFYLFLLTFLLLLAIRVPVAVAMLTPSLLYLWFADGVTLALIGQRMTAGVNSFPILAVPLFILLAQVANASGITDRLFDAAESLIGWIRGGLAYVNISVSFAFSWMSGIAIADAAGLGSFVVKAMTDRGYDERFSTGLTGASALIGPIMPPSIPAIIYAVSTGVSLGALFVAGIVPAVVLVVVLSLSVYLLLRKKSALRQPRQSPRAITKSVGRAFPPLLTPVIILGSILAGIVTPTEAAALGVVYLLLLALFYRALSPKELWGCFSRTAHTTAVVMFIVAAASMFSWVMAREQVPQALTEAILGVTTSPWIFLLLVNVLLLMVGMVLTPLPAILILAPIFLPLLPAFDIHPLHFGIVMIFNLMVGLLTPPVGMILYVLSSAADVSVGSVVRGALQFLPGLAITLLFLTYVPAISLWLPRLLGLAQ